VRKISLIRLAQMPWTDCSEPHNGVRKWTLSARLFACSLKPHAHKPVKLQQKAPLAMRMLIPTYMELVSLPHQLTQR